MRSSIRTGASTRKAVPPARAFARVLVATDGGQSSDGALRLASLMRGEGADVRAVAVLMPLAPYATALGDAAAIVPVEPAAGARRQALEEQVLAQMQRVLGETLPLDVLMDWTADGVVRQAEDWRADLILMGLGRHRPVDRLLGSEITNRVVREGTVPVLAVPSDAALLPSVIVAGIDFSRSSASALDTAVALAGPEAELHLVHVGPDFVPLVHAESPGWMDVYGTGVEQRLAELEASVRAENPWLDVRTVRLAGNAAEQLLVYAAQVNADVVVSGAQRHSRADRILFGTVSAQLIRGAHCGVLVTPVVTTAARRQAGGPVTASRSCRASTPVSGADRDRPATLAT